MKLVLVPPGDIRRTAVETFIADTYRQTYSASVTSFARTLVAVVSGSEIRCAAGLRFAHEGFFSECYVDEPFEVLLARLSGKKVDRAEIFEVSSLCSCSPHDAPRFIDDIVAFGENARFEWSVFTATGRLVRLLQRMGLPLVRIADASADLVAQPASWGSYYDAKPTVIGVPRGALRGSRQLKTVELIRAVHP